MIGRKFACLLPTEKTRKRLENLSRRLNLDITKGYSGETVEQFPYHLTLLYSVETDRDFPDVEMPLGHILSLNGSVVTHLGDAIVLKTTKTPKLLQIRNNLLKNLECTSPYDDFIPHVSLTYIDNPDFDDPTPLWYKALYFDRIQIKTST